MKSAVLMMAILTAAPLHPQSVVERTPNIEGIWSARPGTIHFHFMHRFQITDPPLSKVLNSPTFLLATGVHPRVMVGARYASNSVLRSGEPNEWEALVRWHALRASDAPVELSAQVGWNGTARSVDVELLAGGEAGPARLLLSARSFSAFAGGRRAAAVGGGARLRLRPSAALAADVTTLVGVDGSAPAWSVGLQLAIPFTPHSFSLHLSNANTTTLQGASVGLPERMWGFEFTIPLTLSRYFGNSGPAPSSVIPDVPAMPAAARAVVEMDNRLRFLPDTIRVAVGETVLWRNTSDVVHTVTADPERAFDATRVSLPSGAAPFDSGNLPPGATFEHAFSVPGVYRYLCVPHELAGMVGVVIVE